MKGPFAQVYCADWSKDPAKRAVCVADVAARRVEYVRRSSPWTVGSLIRVASEDVRGGRSVVAFDAPIGVPASYLAAVRPGPGPFTFVDWLPGTLAIPGFYEPSKSVAEWSPRRPFFAVPPGKGGRSRWEESLRALHIDPRRRIDRKARGSSPFIAAGTAGSVGSAAAAIWQELAVLVDKREPTPELRVWPFEGRLEDLTASARVVVAEIFPRTAYAVALSSHPVAHRRPMRIAKTKEACRIAALDRLSESRWITERGVELLGRDDAAGNEDVFDAFLAAAALLRSVLEGDPLSIEALEDAVAEGGILGSGSLDLALPEETLDCGGARKRRAPRRPAPDVAETPAPTHPRHPVARDRCDMCEQPLEPFAAISVTGEGNYCFRCYNDALAGEHDIDFDNAELQPVTLRDAGGRPHTFRIHSLLVGTGHRMEAVEVRDDDTDGYRFCVLGEAEHDALALFRSLYERMRAGLAARHIERGSYGWRITDALRLVGRIESDRELGPQVPCIVVDGQELSWDEFGRMLMTFEGWRMELRIRDYIEVVTADAGAKGDPSEGDVS